MPKPAKAVTAPEQLKFNLKIEVEREIDGVGMGVLSDGTPYLSIRGLARMCGVGHENLVRITAEWLDTPAKARVQKIRDLVKSQGASDAVAFHAIEKDGTIHHTVPAAVCMAILEYYAFESGNNNETASNNFRILARKGFTDFIYAQVGYNPEGKPSIAWQQFHDRVGLSYHTVPDGYFSVFKEIADMLVTMIRQGVDLGDKFIPDISVGMAWAKYWKAESLSVVYGERKEYDHYYPAYFPQAVSNPQKPSCYPDDALGEFRKWVREQYIPKQLPNYLTSKVKKGALDAPKATAAIAAFTPKKIGK